MTPVRIKAKVYSVSIRARNRDSAISAQLSQFQSARGRDQTITAVNTQVCFNPRAAGATRVKDCF